MRRRRKVVLYNPRAVFYTMPLALLAIGSHLDPEEHEVVIIDGRLERDPEPAVLQALEGAVCLGVTVLTGRPLHDAVQISRAAKHAGPACPWSGAAGIRRCSAGSVSTRLSVDVTVQAQGEETFVEIVDRLADGRTLDGCAGCTYRDESGAVVANPPRPLQALDRLRPHDYTLLPVDRYYQLKGKPAARLHRLSGLPLPLRVLRRPVRLRAQVGRPGARADRRGDWRALGAIPVHRRQLPG